MQVALRRFQLGTTAAVASVQYVRHGGASFYGGNWAATSTGNLLYISSMVQADGFIGDSFESGVVHCKVFTFSHTQLGAELRGNEYSVPADHFTTVLTAFREQKAGASSSHASLGPLPCSIIGPKCVSGLWEWAWHDFADLVCSTLFTCRPLSLRESLDGQMFHFSFR